MLQPRVPQQGIIALLMEMQLPPMSQPRINLAIFVNVWRHHPTSRQVVEVEHRAFPNINEKANRILTPED